MLKPDCRRKSTVYAPACTQDWAENSRVRRHCWARCDLSCLAVVAQGNIVFFLFSPKHEMFLGVNTHLLKTVHFINVKLNLQKD